MLGQFCANWPRSTPMSHAQKRCSMLQRKKIHLCIEKTIHREPDRWDRMSLGFLCNWDIPEGTRDYCHKQTAALKICILNSAETLSHVPSLYCNDFASKQRFHSVHWVLGTKRITRDDWQRHLKPLKATRPMTKCKTHFCLDCDRKRWCSRNLIHCKYLKIWWSPDSQVWLSMQEKGISSSLNLAS